MSGCLAFDLGMCALTVRDDDGFYRVQVDLYGDAGSHALEAYHPCGFIGRPRDPDVDPDALPTLGSTVLYAWEGNQGHAFLMNDPRTMASLPVVKKGGSMQYAQTADGVSYALFDGDTGAWTLSAGKTISVTSSAVNIGGGATKFLATADLIAWITGTLIPALAAAPGGPITVAPPSAGALTTITKAS